MELTLTVANSSHFQYAQTITEIMEDAAKIRGTGIARRNPEYIQQKMAEGKAVIALYDDRVIGFCYIENWEGEKYVANSGLIVHPDFRNSGLARAIKKAIFDLSKQKFPNAKLFGITTSMAVMKINSDLGYKPVTFSELTQDETFWKGCQGCKNHDILQRTERKMCLCTGMVCDLSKITQVQTETNKKKAWNNFKEFMQERKIRLQKKASLFQFQKKPNKNEK